MKIQVSGSKGRYRTTKRSLMNLMSRSNRHSTH